MKISLRKTAHKQFAHTPSKTLFLMVFLLCLNPCVLSARSQDENKGFFNVSQDLSASESSQNTSIPENIDLLIDGSLPAEILPDSLFRVGVTEESREQLRWVLRLTQDSGLYEKAISDPTILEGLSNEDALVSIAQAKFLRLPLKRQQEILSHHNQILEEQKNKALKENLAAAEIVRLEEQKEALQNFLNGKPTKESYLTFSLLAADLGILAPSKDDLAKVNLSKRLENGSLTNRERLIREIANLRQRILSLPDEEISVLQTKAGISESLMQVLVGGASEQEIANQQKSEAAAQEKEANNEVERLAAAEKTRLLSVRVKQAEFKSLIDANRKAALETTNISLGLRRKARDLIESGYLSASQRKNADNLYEDIVAELRQVRTNFSEVLTGINQKSLDALVPEPIDPTLPNTNVSYEELTTLREELLISATELTDQKNSALWERRNALREAMIVLNEARLGLIPSLSAAKKDKVLGFGEEGLAQVKREISQITLELRFIIMSLPQQIGNAFRPILNPTPSTVLSFFKLTLFLAVMFWWSRLGAWIMLSIRQTARSKKPKTFSTLLKAELASYIYKVRVPLNWLIFILGLRMLFPSEVSFIGLTYVWIILTWIASAALALKFLDTLARGNDEEDPRSELRWKSLRLVVGAGLIVGLILSLTDATVGKGAIYNWTYWFCWLVLPPILALLATWWRERIEKLAALRSEKSAIFRYLSKKPDGISGLIMRVFGGALLVLDGVRFALLRRLNEFSLIRDINERRERSKAVKQAAADTASGLFEPIHKHEFDALDPHFLPVNTKKLSHYANLLPETGFVGGTITIIVGERGLGKTALLRDIAEDGNFDNVITTKVRDKNLDAILKAIPAEDLVSDTFSKRKKQNTLIIIDDCQRLISPSIGGIADFDRLLSFMRSANNEVSWVLSMGRPSWNFLTRARQDRVMCDVLISLPKWSIEDIKNLLERRADHAGIKPSFSQLEDVLDYRFDGELTPLQRKKSLFFETLYEYCGGNPAIALEFWRRSLYREKATNKIVVRSHSLPDVEKLSKLPQSSLFVLRTILQMDSTSQEDVCSATDLSPMVVKDALRSLERLEVVESDQQRYRISLFWWTEVVRALQRQNMLMKGAVL